MMARSAHAVDQGLVRAAEKEGEVVWCTTLIVNQAVLPIQEAFERKYPKIRLAFIAR
jgi:hypothetical protein